MVSQVASFVCRRCMCGQSSSPHCFFPFALFETCEPGAGGVNARRRQHGRDPDESQETHTRGRPPGPRSQRDPDSYRNGPSCRTPQWWLSSRLFVRRLCVSICGACAYAEETVLPRMTHPWLKARIKECGQSAHANEKGAISDILHKHNRVSIGCFGHTHKPYVCPVIA